MLSSKAPANSTAKAVALIRPINLPRDPASLCYHIRMNGRNYERAVARYLKNHGYHGVKVTKGSGDYGVDVLARRWGHKYAVQCKYYSRPVGVSAVQQVVAGMAYYDCDRAIVVTNTTFTRQAKELAESNGIDLIAKVSPYNGLFRGFYFLITTAALVCAAVDYYRLYAIGVAAFMLLLGIFILYLRSLAKK